MAKRQYVAMIKYIAMTADVKIPCFSCSSYRIETPWQHTDIKLFMHYEDYISIYLYQHFYYVFVLFDKLCKIDALSVSTQHVGSL